METAETVEKVGKEIKKVKFEDFDPKDAEAFLSGWKSSKMGRVIYPHGFIHCGWEFRRTIDGKEWKVLVNHSKREVRLMWSGNAVKADEIRLRDVNEVEFDYQNGVLSFLSQGNRAEYAIARDGLSHFIRTLDGEITSHRWVGSLE